MKKLFIPIILLSSLLFGCCKEESCPGITVYESNWIPYQGTELIKYQNPENDSLLLIDIISYELSEHKYPSQDSKACNDRCMKIINYRIQFTKANQNFYSNFIINKTNANFYFVINNSISGFAKTPKVDEKSIFDLREAIKLDSLLVNGEYLEDVYKFNCYPEQENVAESFVKNGIGLVKMTFRDGQEFELVEHRKAE
jgi:hypothetical protein